MSSVALLTRSPRSRVDVRGKGPQSRPTWPATVRMPLIVDNGQAPGGARFYAGFPDGEIWTIDSRTRPDSHLGATETEWETYHGDQGEYRGDLPGLPRLTQRQFGHQGFLETGRFGEDSTTCPRAHEESDQAPAERWASPRLRLSLRRSS
jgi:hypothetical protein